MLIAVCDDEIEFCKKLKTELYAYSNAHNIETVVEIFNDGISLLDNKMNFDIIFLDYQMPRINGLQIAKAIRKNNNDCTIIFLTNYPEIVYDTFLYDTFRFLVKPLKTTKLYEALESYQKKINLYYPISVNISGETYKISTKDIMYIEADGRNCIIRLQNASLPCSKTLAKVFSLLPHECFFKTHRSYVVNLFYIEKYDKKEIVFTNGELAKISREVYSDFNKAINTFLNNYVI